MNASSFAVEGSFRDPSGYVFEIDGRILRTVNDVARQAYEAVKRGEIPSIRIGKRILISTRVIERILAGEPPEAVGK